MPYNPTKLDSLQFACQGNVAYVFGAKPPLTLFPPDWNTSDCSGYSRWLVYHLYQDWLSARGNEVAEYPAELPEGSVEQHVLYASKQVTQLPTNGHYLDNVIRIAFLEPVGSEPGHVMIVYYGYTYECCGGLGVTSRPWGSQYFMSRCKLYNLIP